MPGTCRCCSAGLPSDSAAPGCARDPATPGRGLQPGRISALAANSAHAHFSLCLHAACTHKNALTAETGCLLLALRCAPAVAARTVKAIGIICVRLRNARDTRPRDALCTFLLPACMIAHCTLRETVAASARQLSSPRLPTI